MTQKVLDDYTTAPIDEKLRATLHLLRKMTLEPEQLGPQDVRQVLATGVSRQGVEDALHVAFLFNIYDRMADSMGWDVPEESGTFYSSQAKALLDKGYGFVPH